LAPSHATLWPNPEEEKEYLDEYIEMLKEELSAAEEYWKELEEPD